MIETEERGQLLSLTDAARKYHVTRQAVYRAIDKGLVPAYKHKNQWRLYEKDYDEFRANKYNRCKSKFNGKLLYDPINKELSPRQVAKMFGKNEQQIYYMIKKGRLPHERRGAAVILTYEACMARLGEDEEQLRFA